MLPRILHCTKAPRRFCSILKFGTHWFDSEGTDIHYILYGNQRTRKHSSLPSRRNLLYYVSWVSSFLQKQIQAEQLDHEFSKCRIGRDRTQDPEDTRLSVLRDGLLLWGASQWFTSGTGLPSGGSCLLVPTVWTENDVHKMLIFIRNYNNNIWMEDNPFAFMSAQLNP